MTIATDSPPSVGILATGDELTNGDVLNTNSYYLANQLTQHGITAGCHLVVADDQHQIIAALRFLLAHHRAVVTIGGLGPTCDDLTRFALAHTINQSLEFDAGSWEHIQRRLQRLNLAIPDNNRQQCLFPQGATVLLNNHGTANGCYIAYQQQDLFMLPGPPNEFKPLVTEKVLPHLLDQGYAQSLIHYSWLLLGASEGGIATELAQKITHPACHLAYRVDYPYLEVKLGCNDREAALEAEAHIDALLAPYLISRQRESSITQLIHLVTARNCILTIDDQATRGHLAAALLTPATCRYFKFQAASADAASYQITITGLDSFWAGNTTDTDVTVQLTAPHSTTTLVTKTLRYRQQSTLAQAIAQIGWSVCDYLRQRP